MIADPGRTVEIEGRMQRADESYCWLAFTATNHLGGGAIDGVVVNSRDITDRKRERERRQRTVDRMDRRHSRARRGLAVIEINEQAEEILDIESEAVRGENIWDVFPAAVGTRFNEAYKTAMEERKPVAFEEPFEEMGMWFEVNAYPEPHGGISIYFRDITEHKEYEQRLEAQRDDLRLLNQLVRHDIRNDLLVIQSHGELLAADAPEELQSSAESIISSAKNSIALTEEARDLSTVMMRSGDAHEPTPLSTQLKTQVQRATETHEDATIEIDGTIPSCSVVADDMLGSVFDNLLQNSIVHNDTPSPRTVVSASVEDGHAVVWVADNGPGIDESQRGKIFDKGVQGTDSGGTGIGLYLVKTLVEGYGGTVDVEDSTLGGAAFVVRLPLAK